MTKHLKFRTPLPPLVLGANRNRKGGWLSKEIAYYRNGVMVDCRNAMRKRGWKLPPKGTRVVCSITFLLGKMRKPELYYRPQDPTNAVHAFKPGFDGLSDAKAIRDDNFHEFKLGDVEILESAEEEQGVEVSLRWEG